VARLLREAGIDVLTTQDAGRANGGFSDESQLEFAVERGRAIFTHNVRDFAPLAASWAAAGRAHHGIVVSEIRPPWELAQRMQRLAAMYPEGLPGLFLRLPPL
jgi:hypothetical protein